jgi:hypothetical protein
VAKIAISFHALPSEIIALVSKWAEDEGLHVVTMEFAPGFRVELLESGSAFTRHIESSHHVPRRVYLCRTLPSLDVTSPLEFMNRNPDCLIIDLGRHSDGKLAESVFAANTDVDGDLKVWRRLAADLKGRTKAGLWGVNPTTGARHFYKQNRYTAAVADEAKRGLQLVPIAGWNLFFIERPIES